MKLEPTIAPQNPLECKMRILNSQRFPNEKGKYHWSDCFQYQESLALKLILAPIHWTCFNPNQSSLINLLPLVHALGIVPYSINKKKNSAIQKLFLLKSQVQYHERITRHTNFSQVFPFYSVQDLFSSASYMFERFDQWLIDWTVIHDLKLTLGQAPN